MNQPAREGAGETSYATRERERRSGKRGPVAIVALVAAVLLVLAIYEMTRGPELPQMVGTGPYRLLVAPFRVSGASSELHFLRDSIVQPLSQRLSDSIASSVDADAVLAAWRGRLPSSNDGVARERAAALAAQLGAQEVVVGSVVGSRDRMIVQASIIRAPGGEVVGEAQAEGAMRALDSLLDNLAGRLMLARIGETEPVVGRLPASLSALRAYIAGQNSAAQRDYDGAIGAYLAALAEDSSFARAALRLAWVSDRVSDFDNAHRGVALAFVNRERLSDRDAALLGTFTGDNYPAPSSSESQLLSWRRVVDVAPGTPMAWLALGTRIFHDGEVVAMDAPAEQARAALERAASLVGSGPEPAELMFRLTQRTGAAADSVRRARALSDTSSSIAAYLRWRDAQTRSDTAALAALRARFDSLPTSALRLIAMAAMHDTSTMSDAARAIDALTRRPSVSDAREALHSLRLNSDSVVAAPPARATRGARTQRAAPAATSDLPPRARVLDGIFAGALDSAAFQGAARELERAAAVTADTTAPADSVLDAERLADRCALGLWRMHRRDTTGVRAIIVALRSHGVTVARPRHAASPHACASLLDASLAVATNAGNARALVDSVDALAFTPYTSWDAAAFAPLLMSRQYERLGDANAALRSLRRRSYMTVWPRYLSAMRREDARITARVAP